MIDFDKETIQQAKFEKYETSKVIKIDLLAFIYYQGNVLIASSCLVGLNGFVVKPWVTTTGRKMNEFEADRGYGNEPGPVKGEIVNDPKYIEIKKDFIKAHAASALINVVNMGFSIFHTWYLANRISF